MTDTSWNVRMDALREYVASNGDALVPVKHVASVRGHGDVYLGTWVSYLRNRYKTQRLAPERIAELESLRGWQWELRPGPAKDEARDREIKELREQGNTLQSIGEQYNLSRQRVHQILARAE